MLNNYMGILCLNEKDSNIKSLTQNRPLASIPLGGRYRVIDFILSNMVNSGIKNIGVLTHNHSRSLIDHLGSGSPWDLDRKIGGLFFNTSGHSDNFCDIEVISNNIEHLHRSKESNVIISSSYMICNINLEDAVKYHEESGSKVTILYKKISDGKKSFRDCDVLNIDDSGQLISVGKNIGVDNNLNISMEMFIMSKETLISIVYDCIKKGIWSNIKNYIYSNIDSLRPSTYEFKGYLQCVNSLLSYYNLNMDLLDLKKSKDLFYSNGLIFTKISDCPPTKYTSDCTVINSLIANGCIIEGSVENCIIGRRVKISKGATLKNCIIMQDCTIGTNSSLCNVIMDKNVLVENNKDLKGDIEFPLVIQKRTKF